MTTLGHGLVEEGEEAHQRDIRDHRFHGNLKAVSASIDGLYRDADGMPAVLDIRKDKNGVVIVFKVVSSSNAVLEKVGIACRGVFE